MTWIDLPLGPLTEPAAGDTPVATAFDREMMRRCLALAEQALGRTAPNPLVGAVIVRDREVLGEGFHPGAGQPHAEVFALRAAGDRSRGATAYVSLEPCNHYGRTPPCAKALVEAGVAKVVVGTIDPNPQVAGSGLATLRSAGIEVIVGVEQAACQKINEAFFHRIQRGRPFGVLKYAMTLDGKIATTSGHSAWVTQPTARSRVHRLRAACDAAIIGGNTVRRDNPHLTSHGGSHDPLRVVMSRSLDLPRTDPQGEPLHLWQTATTPTLVFTETGANPDLQTWLRDRGVEVVELPQVAPAAALAVLAERQLVSVLWECGGTLAAQAIADGSVQKILAFIAPKIIGGGSAAPSPVGDLGFTRMTEAIDLQRVTWQAIGSDWVIEAYL